jgi:hypothetical protein
MGRVTRRVCEDIAQCVAQPIFMPKLVHNVHRGKSGSKFGLLQLFPDGRKFAQSGHPENNRQMGEKSPNLVALKMGGWSVIFFQRAGKHLNSSRTFSRLFFPGVFN